LLAWCLVVFVFDLVAMGCLVTTQSPQAARELQSVTGTTHVNSMADMHAAFEQGDDAAARALAQTPQRAAGWLLLNPVDLFRTFNLPKGLAPVVSPPAAALSVLLWLAACLGLSHWKLKRIDL
jgi:hypothetical protein